MKSLTPSLALAAFAGLFSSATAKSGPISVAYIEVNSNNITDVGQYQLSDGSSAFDVAIIFAANIKGPTSGTTPTIYNNPNVQAILSNPDYDIKPLQAKGVKVVLSLLGGGEGYGVSNFASQSDAAAFASVVADTVNQYGLDGIDLDDEYAEYGTNGTAQPNNDSIGWLVEALRSAMPDKLVTFYNYGPASDALSSADPSVGSQLSYSWNAIYSTYSAPSIPGLPNSDLSAAAVQFGATPQDQAAQFASQTVSDGYGAYMTYNLGNGDQSAYVSAFTQNLYGQAATYTG